MHRFPAEFPWPPGTRWFQQGGGGSGKPGETSNYWTKEADVPTDVEEVVAFYRTQLPSKGWRIIEDQPTHPGATMSVEGFGFGTHTASQERSRVVCRAEGPGRSSIAVRLVSIDSGRPIEMRRSRRFWQRRRK